MGPRGATLQLRQKVNRTLSEEVNNTGNSQSVTVKSPGRRRGGGGRAVSTQGTLEQQGMRVPRKDPGMVVIVANDAAKALTSGKPLSWFQEQLLAVVVRLGGLSGSQ